MIVSGIWWKRVDVTLKALPVASLLVLLGGCGLDQLLLGRPSAPTPQEPLPPVRPDAAQADVSAGLAPLLTPQQVLTAVPFGRRDPFAPLPAPAVASPASAQGAKAANTTTAAGGPARAGAAAAAASSCQAEGLRLTGVIRSGGRAEALVSYGALSGSLRIGDRGGPSDRRGRSTALLPAGCVLASIHFGGRTPGDLPSITLQRGTLREKVTL